MQNEPQYPVRSVDNALRLILLLHERGSLRLSDAAEELGVAPSTAHRVFAMLCHHGFAARTGERSYVPGAMRITINAPVSVTPQNLVRLLHPLLLDLRQELDETIHLLVLEGVFVRFIDGCESHNTLRVGNRVGKLLPAYCSSGGKVLLSELSKDEVRRLHASGLPPQVGARIHNLDQLERQLATVRTRQAAVNLGETERGLTAIGVPVRDGSGKAVAAISVAIPTARFDRAKVPSIVAALHGAASRGQRALVKDTPGVED